jgi:hypothetical protein
MLHQKKLIFYELNEVPSRILEDFISRRPTSCLAFLRRHARTFETVTEDKGVLSPWITWPTLHRGITNERHCISDFGQDLTEVNDEYPTFMELLARARVRVGVFGSLHTYPLPANVTRFSFWVPDTFANGPECFPETLSVFQDFNLCMVDAAGRNVSRSVLVRPAATFMQHAFGLGLRAGTIGRLTAQLVSERINRARAVRRRTSQVQIAFDLYIEQVCNEKPDLATFFTNHVASAMHRYWPAKFPEDFAGIELDQQWRDAYADEIDFTMQEADRQIAVLTSFVQRNPEYAFVIASSMGQAAVDGANVVHRQLYISNPARFMGALGVGADGWLKHRAMLPRYIFKVTDSYLDTFRKSLQSLTVNGTPLHVVEHDNNIFQIKLGQENLTDETTVIRLNGDRRELVDVGLENVAIQDETGSYAYHIPQGIMMIYDPLEPAYRRADWRTVSTCDIAPTILANFAVQRPAYMRSPLA